MLPQEQIEKKQDEPKTDQNDKKEENNQPVQVVEHKNAQLSIVVKNLPEGTTSQQISEFCKRVGVLATHPETGEDLILLNPHS